MGSGRGSLIVLDASAMVDLLAAQHPASAVAAAIRDQDIRVPAVFDAEVYAVIRRAVRRRLVTMDEAYRMLFELRLLLITRHAVHDMLGEALAVRDRFGAYDVFYALLARRLGATLVTTDAALSRAAAGFCDVRYLGGA